MDIIPILFNSLHKNNKLLLINSSEVLLEFSVKYPFIGNILVIGSKCEEEPFNLNHSVTYLAETVEEAYLDEALNSPVDCIYADLTRDLFPFSFLNKTFDYLNTAVVLKILNEDKDTFQSLLKYKQNVEFNIVQDIALDETYLIYVP